LQIRVQGKGVYFYSCGSRKDWNFRVTLSKIANGKGDYNTTTDHIEKLCLYFGCIPNALMTIIPREGYEKKEGKKIKKPAETRAIKQNE